MKPSWLIVILCGLALAAFIADRRKKLPKPVFMFFAVAIVVSVCWYSFDVGENSETTAIRREKGGAKEKVSVVYVEAAHDVLVAPGENRFALPIFTDGEKEYACLRFHFDANEADITEQSFIDSVRFFLIYPDGTLKPANGISFNNHGNGNFPQNFGLDVIFALPEKALFRDVRCIVENKSGFPFKVSGIFVGTYSLSESGKEGNK